MWKQIIREMTNDSDKNKNYKVSTQAGKRVFFKNLARKAGKEQLLLSKAGKAGFLKFLKLKPFFI